MKRGRTRSVLPDWKSLLLPASVLVGAMSASAAQAPATPAITKLTEVNYTQTGTPPTGPHAIVIEHDPGLATHTIWRPRDLANRKYGVVVWGQGGCAKDGSLFPEYQSEIASHGFIIVADGPPLFRPPRGGGAGPGAGAPPGGAPRAGAGGPGAAPGGAPRAGGAPGGGRAGGPPGGGGMAMGNNGEALIAAINWIEKEAANPRSRFYNKINLDKIAAMGMSCGGIMSYGASHHPRVKTVGIWNSGMFSDEDRKKIFDQMHGSAIIITGGDKPSPEGDMAHPNGKADFEQMPAKIPVFHGVYPSVGHGGTYGQDNGGPFGKLAVPWLKWQLDGETGITGRAYFTGDTCVPCKDSNWQIQSRGL